MIAVGNVMADMMFRFRPRGDAAFGDDLQTLAQRWREFQRFAKGRFALIIAIDIGVIDGADTEINMLFNKAEQLMRIHLPFHQAPVAHDKR